MTLFLYRFDYELTMKLKEKGRKKPKKQQVKSDIVELYAIRRVYRFNNPPNPPNGLPPPRPCCP